MAKSIRETEVEIAEALIEAIENAEDGGKWVMPWDSSNGIPTNATTNRAYSGGFNYFVLMMGGLRFGDNRWAGASQWKKAKNLVRKDEKGTGIYFPRFKCAKCQAPVGWGKKCKRGHPVVKAADKTFSGWGSSYVFNNQQTQNPLPSAEARNVDPSVGFEAAAEIVAKMGADIRHGGSQAFYSVKKDYIQLPEAGAFKETADYWATNLHEHAHWTGAKSRLNRDGIVNFTSFGTADYAYEELVAEMGSAFVCKHIGVEREGLFDNHVAYLSHWKKKLREEPGVVRKAANEAGAVMRFLLK
jgi:antirestriction protein ArdC